MAMKNDMNKINNMNSNADRMNNMDRMDRMGRMDRMNKMDRMDNMDRIDRMDNMDRMDRMDNMDRMDRMDRMDNMDRMDRMDNMDRMDRMDNMDRMDRMGNRRNINSRSSELSREIESWVKIVIASVLFSFFLTSFVIVHAIVPTGSMMDTIPESSRVIGSRLSYLFSSPKRYDVVAFRFPDNEEEVYLKRVIGLPGESLVIYAGRIYINGSETPLEEGYTKDSPDGDTNGGPYVIPPDCYFVLGDNRNNSYDSRSWNNKFVKKEKILGKVIIEYYPDVKLIK